MLKNIKKHQNIETKRHENIKTKRHENIAKISKTAQNGRIPLRLVETFWQHVRTNRKNIGGFYKRKYARATLKHGKTISAAVLYFWLNRRYMFFFYVFTPHQISFRLQELSTL